MLLLTNHRTSRFLPKLQAFGSVPAKALVVGLALFVCSNVQAQTRKMQQLMAGHEEGDEDAADPFPLGVSASIGTSVGMGTFVPGAKFNPSVGANLSLNPSFSVPKVNWLPKMTLVGGIGFSMEMANAQRQGGVYNRILRVSNFNTTLVLPKIYKEKFTKISIGASFTTALPISLATRTSGRWLLGVGKLNLRWSTPELGPIGKVNFGYSNSLAAAGYGEVATTIPCGDANLAVDSGLNSARNAEQALVNFRSVERLPNGNCVLAGRQSLATEGNSVNAMWSHGDHLISASMSYNITFMRGLSKSEFSSQYASNQNFRESTSASISYTYTVPIEQSLAFTVGASSGYGTQGMDGGLRLPFYDLVSFLGPFGGFVDASNNNTSAFISVSTGI